MQQPPPGGIPPNAAAFRPPGRPPTMQANAPPNAPYGTAAPVSGGGFPGNPIQHANPPFRPMEGGSPYAPQNPRPPLNDPRVTAGPLNAGPIGGNIVRPPSIPSAVGLSDASGRPPPNPAALSPHTGGAMGGISQTGSQAVSSSAGGMPLVSGGVAGQRAVDGMSGQFQQMALTGPPTSVRPPSVAGGSVRAKRVYAGTGGDGSLGSPQAQSPHLQPPGPNQNYGISGQPTGIPPARPQPPSFSGQSAQMPAPGLVNGQPSPYLPPNAPYGGDIRPPLGGQAPTMQQPVSFMQPQNPQFGVSPSNGVQQHLGKPQVPSFGHQQQGGLSPAQSTPQPNQFSQGRPHAPQPPRPRIDPNQIPSPLAVQEADQTLHDSAPYSTIAKSMPPLASTKFRALDEGNCNPRFMRFTTYQFPCTEELLKTSCIPLGAIIQPLAILSPSEEPLHIVDPGEAGPVRCRRCRAYVNPYFQFVQGGQKFVCNLCNFENDVPPEYFCNLDMSGRRRDLDQRLELTRGAVEFVASKEFFSRPALPLSFVFAIDVSWNSIQWGVLARAAFAIKELLYGQPGLSKKARIGIITYDRSVHFYNLKANLDSAQMLVISDINDMFVPLHDGFLVDPMQSRTVIENLLDSLPSLFENNRIGEAVLGASIQAVYAALKDIGGRVFIFQTSLPSHGPGMLKMREDPRMIGTDKEKQLYEPQDQFWKKIAVDLSQAGICADMFLFPNAYIDIATIGTVSALTGGDTYYYQNFDYNRDGLRFGEDLKRSALRPTGYEALLRIRCSNGLKIKNYFGNFYMKNSTDVELAGIDSQKSIGIELKHEGKLDEKVDSSIQAALLYTTSEGERRIRVLNYSIPNTTSLANVFRFGEIDTTVNFLAKTCVDQAATVPLKTIREQLTDKCVKILTSYRKNIASSTAPGQLILPESFKLYPLYTLALQKSKAFRGGPDISTDGRVFGMRSLRSMSVPDSIPFFYPRLIPLHGLAPEIGTVDERGFVKLPAQIRVSYERLDASGFYLAENGIQLYLWIGRNAPSELVRSVFGVEKVDLIDSKMRVLPVLENQVSQQIRSVLGAVIRERSRYMQLQIVRHQLDPYLEVEFANFLVEDQNHDGMTYVDYLCFVHRNIQLEISSS